MSDLPAAKRASLRRLLRVDSETILEALTTRQFVRPHDALGAALKDIGQDLGFGGVAMDQSAKWLDLDLRRSIGRLRRCELIQISKSAYRFWRRGHASVNSSCAATPASSARPASQLSAS